MVFSSTLFLFIFLPFTLSGYYLIRRELRNSFLLLMSLLFYAVGEPLFIWVMLASIIANYVSGIILWYLKNTQKILRRTALTITLLINIGILFYYKYFDFVITNINSAFKTNIPLHYIALPIGISFFTFQGISYVLDVYMGKTNVQKNPLHIALYIALFPQLIAGPIVRYSDIAYQIIARRESLGNFAYGVQRFAIGLSKKVILANALALLADKIFATASTNLGPGLAWLGALAYALQIYFDFSGYSDMAIGLGRMFGFHFLENFNYPYISSSIREFWRRWHISLSSWFRDYVYIPLGGNRNGNVYFHLLTVFFLTGLWHGASWNFIVWGLWHGFFLILERIMIIKNITLKIPVFLKWIYTMLIVLIGWVFFRTADLLSAVTYLKCMFGAGGKDHGFLIYIIQDYGIIFILAIICSLPLKTIWKRGINSIFRERERELSILLFLEPIFYSILLALGIICTVTSTYNPFIYFNF